MPRGSHAFRKHLSKGTFRQVFFWSRLSKQPGYNTSQDAPDDRLLSVYLAAAKPRCVARVQRLRLDWVLRHCIRVDAPDAATRDECAKALEDTTYNQGE